MVHRTPVYIYLFNVPSFSSRYFNKIKRMSRLWRLLALSLEILYIQLFNDFHMPVDFLVSTYRPVENSKGCYRFLKGSNKKLIKHRIRYEKMSVKL